MQLFEHAIVVPNQRSWEIMMRIAFAFLLLAAAVSLPVHARDKAIKFEGVQEHCIQTDKIKFGANAKWSDCRVTKGRWFATLEFIDMYQAQYCLGKGDGACEQRAFLVFGNRAYTPNAKVMLQQIDPGTDGYDEPRLVQTKYGDILTLSARLPGGGASKRYYRWHSGRWLPVESRGWLRDLAKRLPKGETITGDVWPDIDSMTAQATLSSAASSGPGGKVAEVELGIAKDRFTVKKVTLAHKAE
jgi:hypothetical protein